MSSRLHARSAPVGRTLHEITLADTRVGYALRRARRRSIGFSVRAGALDVAAPPWLPLAQIEAALRQRADWIARKLAESRDRLERAEAARVHWCCGVALPVQGRLCTVRLDPALAEAMIAAGELRVALPRDAAPARIGDAVRALLQDAARRCFTERLDHFAPQLGVRWRRLSLSNAATRWGSARSDGGVRLHWRLIQVEPDLLDYVVVHELAHLRQMNHGPLFWALVASVLPGHAVLRRRLRTLLLPPWD